MERSDSMYDCYRHSIAEDRSETYPLWWVVAENLLYLGTWVIASALLWPLQVGGWPVATWAWAAIVVVIQVWLKKHNCSGCYYYGKRCHLGWGTLAARLFEQDSGDLQRGMRLSLFYVVSPPLVLVAAVLLGLLQGVAVDHWILLGAYVVLNAASFPIRVKGCGRCAMRRVCPGSAVKPKRSDTEAR